MKQIFGIFHDFGDATGNVGEICQCCERRQLVSKEILGQSQTVSAATEEQTVAIEQIGEGSQSLAKMAEELQSAIQKFKI
ncbi:MAG: methyl-accepting chemotaxis sensory transducer with Cache sensor [Firmicutes bacterium]|nr:methyl-accepting chemotaxis sensory transducer with Cache sensor [Bacillota bacterium]